MGLVGFAAHASPLPFCTGVWSHILLTDPCRPTPMPEDCVYVAAVKGTPRSPSSDGVDEPSADARQRRRLHLFNDRKRQAPDTTSPREEPAPSRAVRAPGADPRTLERTARFGPWLLPQTRSWAGRGGIRKAANRESNLVVKGNISHLRPREQYFNPFDLT